MNSREFLSKQSIWYMIKYCINIIISQHLMPSIYQCWDPPHRRTHRPLPPHSQRPRSPPGKLQSNGRGD